MFQRFHHRGGHYLLLMVVAAGLYLVNLGGPSLWDIDEGNNAEAAREMLDSGNWVVPTCNYRLRTDKPALLYWLQIAAYQQFGINEFSARLPSALASLLALLLAYELGRRQFGPSVGLLAGLILASTLYFCASAHFANPDALLNAFTILTLLIFWIGFDTGSRHWFVPAGASAGLAMLAKGPVGLLLPGTVVVLFLLWSRRLRVLLDYRLGLGFLALLLVAGPWFGWVAFETKLEFLQGFFFKHHVERFLRPMENHSGAFYYYPFVLMVGMLPWSAFLLPTLWDTFQTWRAGGDSPPRIGANQEADAPPTALGDPLSAFRFLICWIVVYLVFFSFSKTKLPNYILPICTPVALLIARFLERWRRGVVEPSVWVVRLGLVFLVLIEVGAAFGLLAASGVIEVSVLRGRKLVGPEVGIALGLVQVLGAAMALWFLRRQHRLGVTITFTTASILFMGILGAYAGDTLNAVKVPKSLAQLINPPATEPDIRIGAFNYYRPSLIFYCQREVRFLFIEEAAVEMLGHPRPVYLFIPAPAWEQLESQVQTHYRILGRQYDFYRNYDVVLVTNR